MSNDYTDLTDLLKELVQTYMDEYTLQDLDAWETDDLLLGEAIFQQALELRLDDTELERIREMASREIEESNLIALDEYIDCQENDIIIVEGDQADLEAEYDDPLFVG